MTGDRNEFKINVTMRVFPVTSPVEYTISAEASRLGFLACFSGKKFDDVLDQMGEFLCRSHGFIKDEVWDMVGVLHLAERMLNPPMERMECQFKLCKKGGDDGRD